MDTNDRSEESASDSSAVPAGSLEQRNRRLMWLLVWVAVLFTGFGFALVPLYDVICRVTGLNGRTSTTAAAAPRNTQVDATRWVRVEFLSHSMPGVSIEFAPAVFTMNVHPGALAQVSYVATNTSNRVFTGRAIPSVTPAVAAPHFKKIECFCFREQTFQPGETRVMPVVFTVDPEMARELSTVTLSYAFFEAPKAPKDLM
jgi:cytochrome c oxidase assembly protein subunit 11